MSAPSTLSARQVVDLTVPPVDAVNDLHGDPLAADLCVFMNGNQFMVMEELVAAFQQSVSGATEVFYETIPPGKLLAQARAGTLQMGSLRLSVRPDVLAAGPRALQPLHEEGVIEQPVAYASNDLALLVAAGNPKGITSLHDLGEPGVRIAMPNLQFEGVAQLIAQAIEKAGGEQLRRRVFEEKVGTGETRWTQIHHRESALWLEADEVDVCPLWSTEARHHCVGRGAPMETIRIPDAHNVTGTYGIAPVRDCAHGEAARRFIEFVRSDEGQSIYRAYGFAPPAAGSG